MLKDGILDIIEASRANGWVLEPDAKKLLSLAGLPVPNFSWVKKIEEAEAFVEQLGYPVAAKVVSKDVLHKSDAGGVVVGINGHERLVDTFQRFSRISGFDGMLVENMLSGIELILGAKIDYQFGPVVLLGIGGTAVEIYKDVSIRMAPLSEPDIGLMVKGLKGRRLLEGHRKSDPVDLEKLTRLVLVFSTLVMELEAMIESIDLNPVMCTKDACIVADARILLKPSKDLSIP